MFPVRRTAGLLLLVSSGRAAGAVAAFLQQSSPFIATAPAISFRPTRAPVRLFAQPRKKLPERSVKVFCSGCKTQLFLYKKGGKGSLVKCFKERIVKDFTETECVCPKCQKEFARPAMIRGKPAFKIIGGKAYQK